MPEHQLKSINGKGRKLKNSEEKEALKKEFEVATSNPCQSDTYKIVKKYFKGFNPK